MKKRSYRGKKLGEEMRRIVSDLLARELKDPAFSNMISITHVKASDDGSYATVYYTSLGSDDDSVMEAFRKAQGFIRSEIGRRLGIRRAPELRFKFDETELYGQRIDSILDEMIIPGDHENRGREVTFAELPGIIDSYERYLIFTHVHLDGDTLGAAVAFADAMREIGREAWVVTGEEVPRTLEIINMPFIIDTEEAENIVGLDINDTGDDESAGIEDEATDDAEVPDDDETTPYLAIAMDFTDPERLEGRERLFYGADQTLCIDHHAVSSRECDINYVEPDAAATSAIVYRLLRTASLPVTERIATALYVGIVTDTGRFQYANTTPETHIIAAELLTAGADFVTSYREIYQNVKPEKLFVQSEMLNTLDIFAGGKAAMAFIRSDTLKRLNAGEDETDGISEVLRGIIGVEVSAFLKERQDGNIKVSIRSKGWLDVAKFAAEFGGGGHTRAAGFTSDNTIEEVCEKLKESLETALKNAPGE